MGILLGASSCLLMRGGISRLSELEIDADKDWQGYSMHNVDYLAAGMNRGSLLVHNGLILQAVASSPIGHEFTSNGPGLMPSWQPPPSP